MSKTGETGHSATSVPEIDGQIGAVVARLRKERGLTIDEMAERLGINSLQIEKYEAGINRISASTLYEYAQIFGVSVEIFFAPLKRLVIHPRIDAVLEVELLEIDSLYRQIADPAMRRDVRRYLRDLVQSSADGA